MNRSDSATTFRQHQGALSWRSLLATFLVLLTVGVSAGVAQTATLSHVPGVVCSGTAPTLTLAVAGIPAITTYNVANPAWPGLEAEEGGAGTANNINVVGNPFGADEVRLITAAEITAEEAAGFDFVYYGSTHNLAAEGIYVSSNGFIRFSDGNPLNNNELTETGIVAQNIPAAAGPNHAIYFLNIDIDPQAADDVDWDIQPVNGVGAVNNALVVTFRGVSQYNPNLVYPYNQVTVQVILYGSTHALTPNRIEVRLQDFPDPGVIPARNHTIGIENLCGTAPAYPAIAPGAHNNATWANGQVPVGGPAVANGGVMNTAWTWDPVAGGPQAYSARLVNVGTNGIIDTYDINGAAQGDDSYVNAIVAGSPVLLPATAISATTRYAAIVQFGSNCEQIRSNVQVITVNPVPVAQTIGGPTSVCQGSTHNFTVAGTVPGSTFLWASTAPGAIVTPSGGQNLSASINFPGGGTLGGSNFNVSAQEIGPAPTNCSITSNKTVTIYLTPSGVIAGPTPQCATGSSGPYTFSGAGAGITYNWTLSGAPAGSAVTAPSGSNTNITWGTLQQPSAPVVATLQLIATTGPGALCSSGPITYAITVNPMPVAKLPLTEGDNTPCVNQQVTYSVVGGVVGNSYAWTLSAGGTFAGADAAYIPGTPTVNKTSMVIAWATPGSKSITITETTGAGCSVAYTHNLTQTVQANPAPVVNGSNTPCQFIAPSGTNPTYQTTPNPLQFSYTVNVPNALNTYTWTVNNGGQIVATNLGAVAPTNSVNGVGITQVIVQWPNTGAATVVVTETTPTTPLAYGCSGTSTFNLTVQATPNAAAFTLTGPGIAPGTNPCANSTLNVYTVTLGADNHTFNVIGGTITASSGAFTPSTTSFAGLGNFTVTWGAGTTGSISHEYANLAGCSAVETYTITIVPRPNGNISGPNAVCGGALNQNYTVVNNTIGGPIATHAWTITAGAGFVASSAGAATPTFTVNYNNSGTGVVTIQDVITGPAPSNCTTTLTYNVNVTQTPAAPTYNAGTLTPCAGATVVYTLNGTAGLTTTVTSVTNGTIVGSNNFVGAVGNITITWGLVPTGGAGSFQYQTQNGACVSGVTTTNVTINALPTVPVITITPNITTFCVSSPFPFLDVTSTSGAGIVSFAWSGTGGLTGVQSDVPAGAPINDRFTINNFGGVGTKVITVTATDGNGCTRSNTITLTIEANPTPVISGPATACQELTDPALTPAGPFTFANSNVYSTALVAGHYYSWTSSNGYIVAYSTNGGGTWTPIAATTTTGVSAILGASQVRVAWYGSTPGKIKVSELNGPVSPPSCQTTTLDYNVTLNVIPLAQTIGVTPQNICAGSTALLTQGSSQAGYTYRLEVSTNAGATWSAPGAVATQAGSGAALAWNIPASVLAYTAVAPNVTDYRFRVTAQTNGTFGTPAVNCGWYVVTPNAQIFVNPQPAVVTPAIVTTLSCQGDLTGIQVNVPGSQTWVLYTLGRRQIRDFAGNPIVPGAFVSIPTSTLAGNGGTLTLTDVTFPAGGNPLLNADNYEYQVTGVTDMTLAPPPNIACTTVMPTTVTTRVFALPAAQVVSFTANPTCWNQDVLVTLTGTQDGVTYEIRRNGLSMAPVVEVHGAVGGGPVSVWIPKLSVLASNPAAPTVVNFDVRARLRTVGGGAYARPTPASNCPFVFGATAVTVNPKPVANITGATTVCGPSNQVYTAGPSAVPATTTYDWLITGAPAGTTPTVANNTGLGTLNPLNVAWGVNNLSCNGVYNPVTATIRLIETNAFACADTTTRTITVNPTIADAAITSADGNSQACIYGGFESHLETYTLNRPVSCVFPVNTTFLWTMPTGAVSGVIRSGQNTNSIVAEWNTTGGTNIGVVSCVVTLPAGLGGCSTTYTFNETVYPLPQPVVNGPISVCQNQAGVIYTADVYPTDTYNWEVVGGLISGGAGLGTIASPATRSGLSLTSITVNWLDTPNNNAYVKLRQVSAAGCQNTTTRFVTVNPTPTPVVNGPDAVCDNRAYTYTTQNNAPSSSFLWSVTGNASITSGANTASATVQTTVAGSFTVTVTETILATNCSKSASKTVTIVTAPTPTITRTAPAGGTVGGACLNQTVTYTVSPVVAGRSYNWSAVNGTIVSGQGTSSINVNWTVVGNGSVTLSEWVTATQCTTTVSQNVTVAGPPTPSINGPNTVCGLSVVTYSTQFVAGNTYAWSLPTNGVITAGAATNACTVTWNNPLPNVVNPATLSVTETNTLSGCFATANLNVSVYYKPTSPAITRVTGSPLNQACNNSTIQYQIPNNAGSNFLWTVTGGTITAGGSSNIVTVQWTSVGNQTLTVTETNGLNASCTGLSTLNVSVTYQPTPSISGNATTCTTNTDTYTTGNVAGSTYAWTLPSGGGTILSGAASNTITVNWTGAGARTVQVVETNGNCSATATLNVSVGQTPTATAILRLIPAGSLGSACVGSTITYATTLTAGNNYAWTVTGGSFSGANSGVNVNTANVVWNVVGTQTLTVVETTAGTNCSKTATQLVNVTYQPTPSISGAATTCTGNTETYSTGNVAGDTYAWTVSAGGTILTGAGSSSITVRWTANGPQTVSVLETATAGGCFASATLNVTVGQTPTLTAITRSSGSPLAQACAGSTVGYTTPNTPGNTYVWSVTGGTFVGASNGVNVSVVNVTWNVLGNQTLTVVETTAGTNCSRTATQNVSVTYQPSPSISGNATTCTGNIESYTTANAAGSSYAWTITPSANGTILSGAASNTISVRWNNAGSATVSVLETSNPGGCFATANLVVSVGQTPTTTAIARTTPVGDVGKACVGQTITYSTQNNVGNTYAWLATGGSITGASNTNTVSVLWNIIGTGTLRVTETTAGTNCSRTVVQNVDVTYTPTPVISGSTVACLNTIQTYSTPAVAGSTYFWSISAANSFAPVAGFPTSNSITVQWIQPGLQTITLTETASGGGCATTVTRQVQVNPIPTPSISSTTGYGSPVSQRPGLVCAGSTHVYTTFATPANVWNWVVTGGTIIGGQNTNTITVTWSTGAGGSVQVTETVPGSTCVTTVKDSIIIKPIPTPNITSATGGVPNVCANSVHTYTTPNVVGNSWVWTVTGGSIISGGGSNTITVQWGAAGPGTVAVTETVLGVTPVCATSTSRAITVNPNPNAPIITGPSPVCATNLNTTPQTINTATYSSNITSTPAAISTYTWSVSSNGQIVTNATTSIGVQWFNTTTVPQNGTVTLTHTNIFGCSTTSSISVTINPNPTPSISGPNSVCQNTIQSYGTPGVPGNAYTWTITGGIIRGGQGTPNVQVEWTLPGGGTLTVSERNTFNCTVLNTLNVTINQLPTARVTASGPTTFCQGGDVTLSAPLGFASYAWNTGETGRNIVANRTGLYWVVVTDNNGCSNSSDSIQVNVFPTTLPIITASGPRTFCEGGSVTLTAPAGFSIYRWSNGATTRSITVTTSGEYTVAIADTNGCTGTSTPVEVIVYAKPQPVLTTIGSTTVCSGDSVIVTAPAGYNSYTWSSSAGTNYGTARTIVVKQTDDITVSVVDINGCVGTSDTVKITLKPAISPVVTANGPLTFCEGNAVTLSAPTGFKSYYWSNGATTREITVTDGGKYTVTVTDNTRCEATSPDLNVKVNLLPARPTINRTGDTLKAISSVADAYQWYRNGTMITGATNQKLIVALPGTYRVEIMDDNTCSSMSQPFDVILTDVNDDVVAGHTNGLEIFPNPTNGMFTVSAITSEAGSVRIELFNLVGEKVLSVNDMAQGGQFKSTVDMGQLASGVYNVVVTTNNERWTVRLVRQ